MQDVDMLVLVSRWIHIMAAIAALGGAAFMLVAYLPAAGAALDENARERLREAVAARWGRVVHGAIAALLITGGFNFVRLAMPPKVDPMPYHAIFGVKFFLALGIFAIATALVGRSPAFDGIRRQARRWLSILLALGALIVLLSGLLNQVRNAGPRVADPTPDASVAS